MLFAGMIWIKGLDPLDDALSSHKLRAVCEHEFEPNFGVHRPRLATHDKDPTLGDVVRVLLDEGVHVRILELDPQGHLCSLACASVGVRHDELPDG